MNYLEILLRRFKADLQNNSLSRDTLYQWFFKEEEGISYAHFLLKEASAENIQWMLLFMASFPDGKIFSFLMLRDLEANTIGHTICSQAFSEKHDVISSQILDSFLNCVAKLSRGCKQDLLSAHNQSEQCVDDIIRQMRVDRVKQTYFRFFRTLSDKQLQPSQYSAFSSVPSAIFIPHINPATLQKKSELPPLAKRDSYCKKLSSLSHDLETLKVETIEDESPSPKK